MKFSGYIINEELIGIFLISYYLGLIILLRYIDKSSNILRISSSATFFAGFSLKNFFINFSLLNLAGIPPLGGFIVKLIIIIEFTETYGVIFTLLVILSSILSIFAYIRPLIVMNNKLNFSLFYPVKINRRIFYTNNVMGLISIIILLITSNFLLIGV
jgi:NADH:ubiquinone oxidoreductase subunit 2 (subunit N)